MKKTFKGTECNNLDDFFDMEPPDAKAVFAAAVHRDTPYKLIVGDRYKCCEYHKNINIFSFGKANLTMQFTVIAPPASIDEVGYFGDLDALIKDYSNRKGRFLILNLRQPYVGPAACAATLSTAVFINRFSDYGTYMRSLRSHYRRRLLLAEKKRNGLQWEKIPSGAFDTALYELYLQVLHHSDFPLETLELEFFRTCPAQIFVMSNEDKKSLAFVMLSHKEARTTFIFGGMDYALLEHYDLYYNMMGKILVEGIGNHSETIDFGQTAEKTKCRLGCLLEPRYMLFLTSNPLLHFLSKKIMPLIGYRPDKEIYHVFK